MTHRDDPERRPWLPCRRHLFEALTAVAPQHRHHARWTISDTLWQRMLKDPALNGDIFVDYTRTPLLLGQVVDLIPGPSTVIGFGVTVDCPGRRES